MEITRRRFFESAAALSAGVALGAPRSAKASLAGPRYRTLFVGPTNDANAWSLAHDFNDAGQVVGEYNDPASGTIRHFFFTPNSGLTAGESKDILTLMPPDPSIPDQHRIQGSLSINNLGVIAGVAYRQLSDPLMYAFRLHPPAVAGGA